jgi:CBS-domain-containing membrane protein
MTRTVKTVTRDMTMRELEKMFEQDGFNTFPVQEDDEVIGLVTKFDFLNCFAFTPNRLVPNYQDLMSRTVADVMTAEFIYVEPATKLTRVLQLIVEHRITSLPVLDAEQRLAGIIRATISCAFRRCAPDNCRPQKRAGRWRRLGGIAGRLKAIVIWGDGVFSLR